MQEVIVKLKQGKVEMVMKSLIKDGMSVTSFSDKSQAKQTYKRMKSSGINCSFKDDCIIQFYIGKSEKEIVQMAEEQVNYMAKSTGLNVEIIKNEVQ